MLYAFHGRLHGQGETDHVSLKSAFFTTVALILTIVAILILFLFMFASRAI